MATEKGFVPLSEMEGYSDDHLAWRVPLPEYVPSDSIGLNVIRLKHLARLDGLGHLRIDSYDGERTVYQAELSSVDAQGNATAGMKTVKRVESLSSSQLNPHLSGLRPKALSEYRWGNGQITVNMTELSGLVWPKFRPLVGHSLLSEYSFLIS